MLWLESKRGFAASLQTAPDPAVILHRIKKAKRRRQGELQMGCGCLRCLQLANLYAPVSKAKAKWVSINQGVK